MSNSLLRRTLGLLVGIAVSLLLALALYRCGYNDGLARGQHLREQLAQEVMNRAE